MGTPDWDIPGINAYSITFLEYRSDCELAELPRRILGLCGKEAS